MLLLCLKNDKKTNNITKKKRRRDKNNPILVCPPKTVIWISSCALDFIFFFIYWACSLFFFWLSFLAVILVYYSFSSEILYKLFFFTPVDCYTIQRLILKQWKQNEKNGENASIPINVAVSNRVRCSNAGKQKPWNWIKDNKKKIAKTFSWTENKVCSFCQA